MWSTWYWSAWGLVKRLQRHDFPRPVTPFSLSPPDTPTTDTTTCLDASPPRLAIATLATGSLAHATGGQPRLTCCHLGLPSCVLSLSDTHTHGHLRQNHHHVPLQDNKDRLLGSVAGCCPELRAFLSPQPTLAEFSYQVLTTHAQDQYKVSKPKFYYLGNEQVACFSLDCKH